LLYLKNAKAILIDTPNDNEQTAQLCSYLKDSMHVTIEKVIVCHFHSDCLGGLEFINKQGIESIGLDLTKNICLEKKLPVPSIVFSDKLEFIFEGEKVICGVIVISLILSVWSGCR
jgi:metallo-beta-lactamase class B